MSCRRRHAEGTVSACRYSFPIGASKATDSCKAPPSAWSWGDGPQVPRVHGGGVEGQRRRWWEGEGVALPGEAQPFQDALPHLLYLGSLLGLTITEVDEWGLFPACFEQFRLKELPIKIHPRTAVFPGHWLATSVVGKQGHVHTTHEESRQLNASGVEVLNLKTEKSDFYAVRTLQDPILCNI